MIKICNSGTCKYEITGGENWGACGKKAWQKCPDDMTEEELVADEEYEDLKADFLWEEEKDRRMGI